MMEEFKRIKRLPPYVFSIVNELKVKARAQGEDIIDFGMGNPDLPTPDHIVDKLVEAARNPRNHRYSASRGITKLRRGICDWYQRRYAVELDPDTEAIATIGAKEGFSHLMWVLLGPGDAALVPQAVEEFVRFDPAVHYFRRTATDDTEIRGRKIAKGQKVVMWYSSANRDEEIFEEPDRFDVGRENNPTVPKKIEFAMTFVAGSPKSNGSTNSPAVLPSGPSRLRSLGGLDGSLKLV